MLTGKQRRSLRAQAHHLQPVVHVGHEGASDGVVAQVDEALAAHELIKVKVSADEPGDTARIAAELGERTRSEIAQIIGHVVVLYRRRPKKPKVSLAGKAAERNGESQHSSTRSKGHGPRRRTHARVRSGGHKSKRGPGKSPGKRPGERPRRKTGKTGKTG